MQARPSGRGRCEITRAEIDGKGNYWVALGADTYVVGMKGIGTDRGADLPKTVGIAGGRTTRLDVKLDGGIW